MTKREGFFIRRKDEFDRVFLLTDRNGWIRTGTSSSAKLQRFHTVHLASLEAQRLSTVFLVNTVAVIDVTREQLARFRAGKKVL